MPQVHHLLGRSKVSFGKLSLAPPAGAGHMLGWSPEHWNAGGAGSTAVAAAAAWLVRYTGFHYCKSSSSTDNRQPDYQWLSSINSCLDDLDIDICCLLDDDYFILFPCQVIETSCATYIPCVFLFRPPRDTLILPIVSILFTISNKRSNHEVASSWLLAVYVQYIRCTSPVASRRLLSFRWFCSMQQLGKLSTSNSLRVSCRSVLSCWPKLHSQSVNMEPKGEFHWISKFQWKKCLGKFSGCKLVSCFRQFIWRQWSW